MLLHAAIFVMLFVCLSFVKTEIVSVILHASHRVSGQAHLGIWLYAILFFPGTVIHELSHYGMAEILRVRTGEIHLLPKAEAGYVKLGYVTVAQADLLRSCLIGIAPFFVGLTAICVVSWLSFFHLAFTPLSVTTALHLWHTVMQQPSLWLACYFVIVLSHAMFLSEADRKELYVIPVILIVFGVVFYLLRNVITIPAVVGTTTDHLLVILDVSFGFALTFNIIILALMSFLKTFLDKIF